MACFMWDLKNSHVWRICLAISVESMCSLYSSFAPLHHQAVTRTSFPEKGKEQNKKFHIESEDLFCPVGAKPTFDQQVATLAFPPHTSAPTAVAGGPWYRNGRCQREGLWGESI